MALTSNIRFRRVVTSTYGATTFCLKTFSTTKLSILGLNVTFVFMILSITTLCNYAECRVLLYCYAECRYAESHYAECRVAVISISSEQCLSEKYDAILTSKKLARTKRASLFSGASAAKCYCRRQFDDGCHRQLQSVDLVSTL